MSARASDAELVERAEKGECLAFDELTERYYSAAVTAASKVLGDIDASRDIARDAFVEAAANLDKLREKSKFVNWIYGIANRKAIYRLRQRIRGQRRF